MIAIRLFLLLGSAVALWAQYAGPAMLTRGEVPGAMQPAQIDFRPYLEINGIYDTGLVGVTSDPNAASDAFGGEVSFGVYGVHRWKRTSLGLDYRGDLRHYTRKSYFDGTDHTLSLGLTRQVSRHTSLSLRESAGTYTRSFGLFAFGGMGTFDPTQGFLPANDYFDNRTDFLTSQADLTYQKSARLSFSAGGDVYFIHYRSRALYGLTGAAARSDMAYRISRYATFGIGYNYTRFRFSQQIGGSDIHGLTATYSVRINKNLELSVYGGAVRAESQFVRQVQLDPAIAALLGTSAQLALTHRVDTGPQGGGRIMRQFRHAQFSINGSYGITPGNGIFLTSRTSSAIASYSYAGLRRWNVGATAGYSRSEAKSDITGNYSSLTGGFGATRQIARGVHFEMRVDARKYDSGTFSRYNRVLYRSTIGLAFTPKDIPLTLW